MGVISITLPIKAQGTFRIRDKKVAKRLVEELEQIGERVTPIDELFGIWADQPERVEEINKIRQRNNRRNG
jgi:tRNA A37 threonylcarbamoyladenosine synthetase subunit TsaC/SUA5/YrdC